MARHDAFISYSRRDSAFAAALERRLEKFRAPRDLPVRQGHLDIFRDEQDFTGGEYFSALNRHLEASSTLIVLCSPNARASTFVNDEIRRFAEAKGAERIIPILVAAVPNNEATAEREHDKAFPDALCEVLEMPLAANYLGFDVSRDRFDRGAYTDAWFTLLANIYGVSRSEIERRERRRRARLVRSVVGVTATIVTLLVAALIVTLISRAEAVRQAIDARRQTATRLAVQALEKLDVAPETAHKLAIEAVETFHRHGDPPVQRALEALHKTRLSFGGGRPVLAWREDQAELVFSSDLVWAASGARNGGIRFTRAGSGKVDVLEPPAVLQPGETWSDDVPALLFTRGRLIAGRPLNAAGADRPEEAVLWYWPLDKDGISGGPQPIDRFRLYSWSRLDPVASGGGRWLTWYGGDEDLFIRDLTSDAPTTVIDSSIELRSLRAFSIDERQLAAGTRDGLVVLSLPSEDRHAPAQKPEVIDTPETSSWMLGLSLAMTARSPDRRCRDQDAQQGLAQAAVLYPNGDVSWWDLGQTPAVAHPLPNLFAAYSEQMKVWRLDRHEVRASLAFSVCGQALLATLATENSEFGISAHIELSPDAGWQPVFVEQLKSMLFDNVSRFSGSLGGADHGYKLTDRKKLGTSDAYWFLDDSLLTIGLDGALEYHDLERKASQYMTGDTTRVAASLGFTDYGGISAGTRTGQLRIFGKDSPEPVYTLSAHDHPVSRLLQDRYARRIVTVDESGGARIWETDNPLMRPDEFQGMSDDWTRYAQKIDRRLRVWNVDAADPFAAPIETAEQREEPAFLRTADGRWAAARAETADTKALTLSLHRISNGDVDPTPESQRTIASPAAAPEDYWRWDYRGWTQVVGDDVRYLATGHATSGDGAVLVSLSDPSAPPTLIVDPRQHLKIEKFTDDLSVWLLSKGELHSDPADSALEVRRGMSASAPYLRIDGTHYGTLSDDGHWLLAQDRLYDLGGERPVVRAEKVEPHAWNYRITFADHRAPLWLDENGNLWGIDAAPGSTAGPRKLVDGLGLNEIAWSDDGEWLGLGSLSGGTWVLDLQEDMTFDALATALTKVAPNTRLPPPWDARANEETRSIDLLPGPGWVKVETDSRITLLWHGSPAAGWSEPLVFHPADGLRDGSGGFHCRADGEVCVVEGQLLKFDPAELLEMSKGILTGAPLRP